LIIKGESARLIAAFCVAIGLHVLLFNLLSSQTISSNEKTALFSISIEPYQEYQPAPKLASPQKKLVPQLVSQIEQVITQQNNDIVYQTKPLMREDTPQKKITQNEQPKAQPIIQQVSVLDVRNHLLSHVQYPHQARRHAWQGITQLSLHIQQQHIHEVVLLASSGYPVLDRAAQQGLALIDTIPLADGIYHLPVEFRLQ